MGTHQSSDKVVLKFIVEDVHKSPAWMRETGYHPMKLVSCLFRKVAELS